jgi:hypothetical protein
MTKTRTTAKRRKTQTLNEPIGHAKADVRMVEIDNPHYSAVHAGMPGNPKTLTAAMNLRESPIAMMAAKGHVGQDHLRAANKFRKLWETLGGAGAGSFDYTREPVDGGGARDPINDAQIDAGRELAECRIELGPFHYDIVRKVAGEGYSISMLYIGQRERHTKADCLREGLDLLSKKWGMSTKQRVV